MMTKCLLLPIMMTYNNYMKSIKQLTLCFTGHRPQKLPWGFNEQDERCLKVKEKLKILIEQAIIDGYCYFWSGMALGFDMMCVEILLELKVKYKRIKIYGALPCRNQSQKWPIEQQKRYDKLTNQLDGIRCLNDNYTGSECMLERNRFMIDNSSKLIALFNSKSGGTKSTIEYAKKKELEIIILEP